MDVPLGMLRADGTFNFGERGLDLPRVGMVKDDSHTALNSAPPAMIIKDWPSEHHENNFANYSWKPAPWGITDVNTILPEFKLGGKSNEFLDVHPLIIKDPSPFKLEPVIPQQKEFSIESFLESARLQREVEKQIGSPFKFESIKPVEPFDFSNIVDKPLKTFDPLNTTRRTIDTMFIPKPIFEPTSYVPPIDYSEPKSFNFDNPIKPLIKTRNYNNFIPRSEPSLEEKEEKDRIMKEADEIMREVDEIVNEAVARLNPEERKMLDNICPEYGSETPQLKTVFNCKDDSGDYQGYAEINRNTGNGLHTFQDGLNAHLDIGPRHKPKLYITKQDEDNQGNPIDTRIKHFHGLLP